MARKTALPDDEAAAFAEAVRGARALEGPTRVAVAATGDRGVSSAGGRSSPPKLARERREESAPPTGKGEPGEEAWQIRGGGLDARAMKRLRKGQLAIDARIDLHGLTRAEAARALERFLAGARGARHRGLLIIHGRGLHSGAGGPALHAVVRDTLGRGAHADAVLAASPAPPALGGAGATLVWLRKS